jgi:hypothetical protein
MEQRHRDPTPQRRQALILEQLISGTVQSRPGGTGVEQDGTDQTRSRAGVELSRPGGTGVEQEAQDETEQTRRNRRAEGVEQEKSIQIDFDTPLTKKNCAISKKLMPSRH